MYVFGGRVGSKGIPVNELWSLQLSTSPLRWQRITPDGDEPVATAMHTATLVNQTIVILWGAGVDNFPTANIQYYDIGKDSFKTAGD